MTPASGIVFSLLLGVLVWTVALLMWLSWSGQAG
jgi:hypothetical protein